MGLWGIYLIIEILSGGMLQSGGVAAGTRRRDECVKPK